MFFNKGKNWLKELMDIMREYAEMLTVQDIAPRPVLVVERDGLRELLAWSHFNHDEYYLGDPRVMELEPLYLFLSNVTANNRVVDGIWRRVMCRPGLKQS